MMKKTILAVFAAFASCLAIAKAGEQPFNLLADLIQVDPATESVVASGHVTAVHAPFRLLSTRATCNAEKVYSFGNPTMFTTCTNEIGKLHWHVRGGIEYKDGEYAILRDGWVHFWEIPVLWVPYLWMPAGGEEGLQVMPGYVGRWGTYVMTKYKYHIIGSRASEDPDGWGLSGNTRFDLRCEQGIALGETLNWRLGDFGKGRFKIYYAWDQSDIYDQYNSSDGWHNENWGSSIPENRYGIDFRHRWDVTERDILRVQGAIFSDSYFHQDFLRNTMFMLKNQFLGYDTNEFAWEHIEDWTGLGVSVSGPLNDFVGGTARLPEFYFDVNPLPVFGLPVNYETENRIGYLKRLNAKYGRGNNITAYSYVPGPWASYETWRIDTYHRLTAPMKFMDVLSVVPRVAYRGTFWGDAGSECPTGSESTRDVSSNVFRSILEGGITFSARGTADLGGGWRHLVEPYLDVLAQKAWYSGLGDNARPYVFDAVDASMSWSDQFASRGRNLPYSWYGLTPGIRNAFDIADERGGFRRYFDIDLYCALQLNDTTWLGDSRGHRLAEVGKPNYGKNVATPVPGFKFSWYPTEDIRFTGRLEYDAEDNTLALAGFRFTHQLADNFSYYVMMTHSDSRYWDFSSAPFDSSTMTCDEFNLVHYSYVYAGFEHELCDAIAWSPYIRWDCLEGSLDSAGSWIDYRTDCLGFRLLLEYDAEYTRIDGSRRDDDWSIGFFIYLRAFGADSANVLQQ